MSLEGKPLRYLIGGDDSEEGKDDEVIELSFDADAPPSAGLGSSTATCSMKIMTPIKRLESMAPTQRPLMSQNNTARVRLIPTARAGKRI